MQQIQRGKTTEGKKREKTKKQDQKARKSAKCGIANNKRKKTRKTK